MGHPGPQRPPEALPGALESRNGRIRQILRHTGPGRQLRSELIQATRRGEAFDTITGLPESQVSEQEIVNFRCNGAVIWTVYLASIVKPDLALTLKHE